METIQSYSDNNNLEQYNNIIDLQAYNPITGNFFCRI